MLYAAGEIVVSEMEYPKAQARGFSGNFGAKRRATHSQLLLALDLQGIVLALHVIAVNPRAFGVRFEQRADRIVPSKLVGRHKRGFDPFFVNALSVGVFWEVALCSRQPFHECGFDFGRAKVLSKAYSASGILHHLHCLQARHLVEEPTATCVHQHGVTLHL